MRKVLIQDEIHALPELAQTPLAFMLEPVLPSPGRAMNQAVRLAGQ
jgi:hypothetical protein